MPELMILTAVAGIWRGGCRDDMVRDVVKGPSAVAATSARSSRSLDDGMPESDADLLVVGAGDDARGEPGQGRGQDRGQQTSCTTGS